MNRTLAFLAAASILIAAACTSEPDPAADEAAIRAVDSQMVAALHARDPDTWLGFLTDDAMMMPPNASAVEGKAAIGQLLAGLPVHRYRRILRSCRRTGEHLLEIGTESPDEVVLWMVRIAVAAKIEGVDVSSRGHSTGKVIPPMGVCATAVQQQQGRILLVAPTKGVERHTTAARFSARDMSGIHGGASLQR